MDKNFLELCEYLDYDSFSSATNEQLLSSLQKLSDYYSKQQGRPCIELLFEKPTPNNNSLAIANIDFIKLFAKPEINYMNYLSMFDCVIHESFHQFEYYLLNLPKECCDDILWQRVISYNLYYMVGDNDISYYVYRFNDFELDAYRYTDLILKTIYNNLSSEGKNVEGLKKYILSERKAFYNDLHLFQKKFGKGAKKIIDDLFITKAIKNIKDNENLNCSDQEIIDGIKNGKHLYSITNCNEIVDISQEFLNTAYDNFTKMLPHLYGSSKPKLHNDEFLKEL